MAGDFVGVVFEPQSCRRRQMRHVAILEVKHLKKGGTASVPSAVTRDARPTFHGGQREGRAPLQRHPFRRWPAAE